MLYHTHYLGERGRERGGREKLVVSEEQRRERKNTRKEQEKGKER